MKIFNFSLMKYLIYSKKNIISSRKLLISLTKIIISKKIILEKIEFYNYSTKITIFKYFYLISSKNC